MSEAVRVEPTIVVLSSATWASELAAELVRLGVPPDKAPARAAHVLRRVCLHAGWRSAFLVAEDEADDRLSTGPAVYEGEP